MEVQQIGGLGRLYVEKFSLYKEFTERIQLLVRDLIEREDIEIYKIESHTKNPGEVIKGLSYMREAPSSFNDIPDLVAVSVLLRFPEDIEKVEQIIYEEFSVDAERSVPARSLDDPLRFGYPSASYVLSLSESRAALREWRKYVGMMFHLDIRTMLQEVWAAVSPKVNVNVDNVTRKKMERKLVRLASMLEEADEGFLSLYEASKGAFPVPPPQAEQSFIREKIEPPIVEASRVYSIEELYDWFSKKPDVVSYWSSASIKSAFPIFVPSPDYLRTSFENLYTILKAAEIDTLEDVEKFVAELEADEYGISQLQGISGAFEKDIGNWRVDSYSALFLLVLNLKWNMLKDKDLVELGVKKGSDRISGLVN